MASWHEHDDTHLCNKYDVLPGSIIVGTEILQTVSKYLATGCGPHRSSDDLLDGTTGAVGGEDARCRDGERADAMNHAKSVGESGNLRWPSAFPPGMYT